MIINRCFEERADYLSMLDELRRSELIQNSPALSALLDNKLIDEYFDRNVGENKKADSTLEKMIAIAAAKTAATLTGAKEEDLVKAGNEVVEMLRDIRLKKLLQEGRITEAIYLLYKKAQKCSFIKSKVKVLYKKYADKSIRYILMKATKFVPNPVIQGVVKIVKFGKMVWDITPQPVKEKVKQVVGKMTDNAIKNIPCVAKKLYDEGKPIVVKSAKILEKGFEWAKEKISNGFLAAKIRTMALPHLQKLNF